MYLKEAFQYQNYLSGLIDTATNWLTNQSLITKTTEYHFRTKANPDAEDEVIDISEGRTCDFNANQVVDFLVHLINEKEVLSSQICAAKKSAEFDIDSAVANNRIRRKVANVLARMNRLRPGECVRTGYAFKFNAEGNQVRYAYDVKSVTAIDFDRNRVRNLAKEYSKRAEEESARVDKFMIEIEVDYKPEFGFGDCFDDAIEQFLGGNAE